MISLPVIKGASNGAEYKTNECDERLAFGHFSSSKEIIKVVG